MNGWRVLWSFLPYLPPHEDVVTILELLIVKVIRIEGFCILVKGLELALITTENVIGLQVLCQYMTIFFTVYLKCHALSPLRQTSNLFVKLLLHYTSHFKTCKTHYFLLLIFTKFLSSWQSSEHMNYISDPGKLYSYPVFPVYILISIPLPRQKWTLHTDDLPSKECRQHWVLLHDMVVISMHV